MKIYILLFISLLLTAVNAKEIKTIKTIHVFVALCDNQNQGIVPVPEQLGNGQKPATNLYWGALYGVKTFFKKSSSWKLVYQQNNPQENIAERVVFKHKKSDTWLVADAYYGDKIKIAIKDLMYAARGAKNENLVIQVNSENIELGINGNANLLAYAGHNGLMEFGFNSLPAKKDTEIRDVVVLACVSQDYFSPYLENSGANPLLLTKGFMAPEAYTLVAVFEGWINSADRDEIRLLAAKAYSKYQKCSLKASKNLFVTEWK